MHYNSSIGLLNRCFNEEINTMIMLFLVEVSQCMLILRALIRNENTSLYTAH